MRIRLLIAALAFLGATAAPGLAAAYTSAYAASGVTNLRAGPGTEYPVIARVLGGSRVNVVGCLSSRSWCDVIVQDIRGWMSTTRLEFLYGGQLVYVPRYYSYFDVPVIGFDFGYWDRHYRDRPWYRDHWRRRDRDHVELPPFDCLPEDPGCNGNRGGGWDGGGWDGGGGNDSGDLAPAPIPIQPDGGWDGGGNESVDLAPTPIPIEPEGGWVGDGSDADYIEIQPDGGASDPIGPCTPDMPC